MAQAMWHKLNTVFIKCRKFLLTRPTYHSTTSVGLSGFVQEIFVNGTYVSFNNLCGAFRFCAGNFCKRDMHDIQQPVGLSGFIQEIFVNGCMYYPATSMGLSSFVQDIFVNGTYVPLTC